MILSAVDFRVGAAEDNIIREYIVTEFPFRVNLDKQMEIISSLRHDEWEAHFRKMMDDFYDDATEDERTSLLDFAVKLATADNVVTKEENHYLNLLFENWKPDEA
jgi:hypothetical protein